MAPDLRRLRLQVLIVCAGALVMLNSSRSRVQQIIPLGRLQSSITSIAVFLLVTGLEQPHVKGHCTPHECSRMRRLRSLVLSCRPGQSTTAVSLRNHVCGCHRSRFGALIRGSGAVPAAAYRIAGAVCRLATAGRRDGLRYRIAFGNVCSRHSGRK